MALDAGNTTVTTSASIVGGVGKVLGDAVIAFNKVNVIAPLVASRPAVVGAKTVEWAAKDPKGYEQANGIVGNAGQSFNVGG